MRKGFVLSVVLLMVFAVLYGCGVPTLYDKGKKAFMKGDYQEAEKKFRESIKANVDTAESHVYLGRIYAISKDYSKAIKECRKALDLAPKAPNSHVYLIVIYQLNNQCGEAERLWDKASNLPGLGRGPALKPIMPSPTKRPLLPGEAAYYKKVLKGTAKN